MNYMRVLDMKRIICQLPDDAEILVKTVFHGKVDETLLTTTHRVDVDHKYGETLTYLIIHPEVELEVTS